MRSRNLKPGYFRNELLGKADPLIGTLFQGLWCEADRDGRLEDRPLRFCGTIFPYRRSVTEKKVDKMLVWLHDHGFIVRYEVCEKRYIQVIEFRKHQRPHSNETPSKIPALGSTDGTPRSDAEADQGEQGCAPGRAALRPSSLIPSSSPPETPLPPQSGGFVVNPGEKRGKGTNSRANGTNPRAAAEKAEDRARWAPLLERAEGCGFRRPRVVDTPETYETSLRLYERDLDRSMR